MGQLRLGGSDFALIEQYRLHLMQSFLVPNTECIKSTCTAYCVVEIINSSVCVYLYVLIYRADVFTSNNKHIIEVLKLDTELTLGYCTDYGTSSITIV